MFRDVAATGVAAQTPSSNTLPPTMPQEGAGDSDGSSEFKDNQCDMSLDIDSLRKDILVNHVVQDKSELVNQYPHRRKRRRQEELQCWTIVLVN